MGACLAFVVLEVGVIAMIAVQLKRYHAEVPDLLADAARAIFEL